MRDWAQSSTRWFVLENRGILRPRDPAALKALEEMGRAAGMCMTRQGDGTMCYEATPCEKDHG